MERYIYNTSLKTTEFTLNERFIQFSSFSTFFFLLLKFKLSQMDLLLNKALSLMTLVYKKAILH